MKIYTLHKKQNLPISVDEAWKFLSDPRNLKTITPDYMGFNILSAPERISLFSAEGVQPAEIRGLLGLRPFVQRIDNDVT